MKRIAITFTLMFLALVGSSYRSTKAAQMPGMPGTTQLWHISSEGCSAAVQADVASKYAAASTAVSGQSAETAQIAADAAITAADLTSFATAYPHMAMSVNAARYTTGSTTTSPVPNSHLSVDVVGIASILGC